ncbi:DinB family protein [Mucilaginibacter pedocola]|uniref:Damage-inducible protein DinB n=1 Tax=Mucilaginibacter pedocola TaxID=1792845 RepID=A0A1S9PM24_9SPHI|nr:DinB family protein [Mucilaginibacter pedocola]OOQ62013.1 damage-inducible protein DinB [Mucilaginibacter pedocola]
MKKLVLLFTVVAFTCTAAFAQITREQSIAEWTRAKAYTKAYLDAMPADGYAFKPTPEMRSFAQQMLHLADGGYFLVGMATGKESPLGKNVSVEKTVAPTKEAVTKAVMDSYDFAIEAVKGMTDAQLSETITMNMGKELKTTRGAMLFKAFEHQTHHRGQTTPYLRLKGVTPPQEMLF